MLSQPPQITYLPYVNIQHDFTAVLMDVEARVVQEESVWVSAYQLDDQKETKSCHAQIVVRNENDEILLSPRGGITLHTSTSPTSKNRISQPKHIPKGDYLLNYQSEEPLHIQISFPTLSIPPTSITIPTSFKPTSSLPFTPTAFSTSTSQSTKTRYLALGSSDGDVVVHELFDDDLVKLSLDKKKVKVDKNGMEKGDVESLKFFPSGEVLLITHLSGAMTISSALTGSTPRTLLSHKRRITSTSILGVGKRILTSSLDGTVKLWDIVAGAVLKTWDFGVGVGAVHGVEGEGFWVCSAEESGLNWFGFGEMSDEGEVVSSRNLEGGVKTLGGVTAILALPSNGDATTSTILTATSNGFINVYGRSTTNLGPMTLKMTYRRTTAPISSLTSISPIHILVASEDGMPFIFDVSACKVDRELSGFDGGDGGLWGVLLDEDVWIAGREGVGRWVL